MRPLLTLTAFACAAALGTAETANAQVSVGIGGFNNGSYRGLSTFPSYGVRPSYGYGVRSRGNDLRSPYPYLNGNRGYYGSNYRYGSNFGRGYGYGRSFGNYYGNRGFGNFGSYNRGFGYGSGYGYGNRGFGLGGSGLSLRIR